MNSTKPAVQQNCCCIRFQRRANLARRTNKRSGRMHFVFFYTFPLFLRSDSFVPLSLRKQDYGESFIFIEIETYVFIVVKILKYLSKDTNYEHCSSVS